jgi:hypothetical protein
MNGWMNGWQSLLWMPKAVEQKFQPLQSAIQNVSRPRGDFHGAGKALGQTIHPGEQWLARAKWRAKCWLVSIAWLAAEYGFKFDFILAERHV